MITMMKATRSHLSPATEELSCESESFAGVAIRAAMTVLHPIISVETSVETGCTAIGAKAISDSSFAKPIPRMKPMMFTMTAASMMNRVPVFMRRQRITTRNMVRSVSIRSSAIPNA